MVLVEKSTGTIFLHKNRKQVNFPLELKSPKPNPGGKSLVSIYGRIEGINNKIKVLNRVASGYRNFHNFKKRIILHFKLRDIIQKKDSSSAA